jgi:hypothetical protein
MLWVLDGRSQLATDLDHWNGETSRMENGNDRHDEGIPLSPGTGADSNKYANDKGRQFQLLIALPTESVIRLDSDNPERARRVAEIRQAVADDSYHVESADLADKLRCHPFKRHHH